MKRAKRPRLPFSFDPNPVLDRLAERARHAVYLTAAGEPCPMSWFANSPLYWNLLLVHGTGYRPPYLRPLAPVAGQLEMFS